MGATQTAGATLHPCSCSQPQAGNNLLYQQASRGTSGPAKAQKLEESPPRSMGADGGKASGYWREQEPKRYQRVPQWLRATLMELAQLLAVP